MYANQRISGPYFPSHVTSSPDQKRLINEQLNHWCEEIECSEQALNDSQREFLHQKSKIIKLAPSTFMN